MGGGIVPASASSDPCSDLHINIETISVNIVVRRSRNLKRSHKTRFQIHNFAAYQAQHSFLDLLSTSNNMKPILSSSYQFLLILLIFFEYFLYYIHIS